MARNRPIPLVIDCDPGTDDAVALLLAAASPELDLVAVTAAGGNVGLDHTLRNALALMRLAGHSTPVYSGADRPLLGRYQGVQWVHGEDGMGGVGLPPGGPPAPGHAADALRALLRTAPAPVTLVGIAPVTNLGLALATEPALADKIAEIVLMTGAWGEGNATPAAEFNALSDPEALQILLGLGRPITIAGLELTAQALVTPARIAALRTLGGGACLQAACDVLASVPHAKRLGGEGSALHDPCAVAWLIAPHLFTARPCFVEVDCGPGPNRGRTVIDRWDRLGRPHNARVLETLDADGFFALLGQRLARLP
ncbi:MAG: nucleoside hydrolase [Proteobacteria bacterium]|nr:nucleoside hydrolase [Pseudomonadota bacterium]